MHPTDIGRMPCRPTFRLLPPTARAGLICSGCVLCSVFGLRVVPLHRLRALSSGSTPLPEPEPAAPHLLIEQVLERPITPPLDGPVRLLAAPLPHRSRASRSPVNCQRAVAGKKLR